MNLSITTLAEHFIQYFRPLNTDNIPELFIKEYYILSHGKFISVCECEHWLGINRRTLLETLRENFKKNNDYFETSFEDELKYISIINKENLKNRTNQKYIIIKSNCFRDICLRSLTIKGKLARKYNIKIDDLFKDFHLNYINKLNKENEIILHNQKKIKLTHDEGIYVWKEINDLTNTHKIGRADDIYGRIATHNSSHQNKIVTELIVYTKCSFHIESMVKLCLENYLYRGEFFKCDVEFIEKTIKDVIKLLTKYNNNCKCIKNINNCSIKKISKKNIKKNINKNIKN